MTDYTSARQGRAFRCNPREARGIFTAIPHAVSHQKYKWYNSCLYPSWKNSDLSKLRNLYCRQSLHLQTNQQKTMKKQTYLLTTLLLIGASAFTFIQSQNWNVAEGYSVKFDGGDPSGEFTGLKGVIQFDEKDLAASKFDMTLDVASINTGNGMKNTHAKSANWFDAEKYPTIAFTSTAITKTGDSYEAKGILEMHGMKKETIIPFTFANNTFAGNIEVNRMDFGLDDGKHPKMMPTLKVSINVPVTK